MSSGPAQRVPVRKHYFDAATAETYDDDTSSLSIRSMHVSVGEAVGGVKTVPRSSS